MATFLTALSGTATLFLFILCGYVLQRKVLPEKAPSTLAALLMNFFTPIMMVYIITSYVNRNVMTKHYPLIIIACLLIAVSYYALRPLSRLFSKNKNTADAYWFSLVYSNFGFMAIPIIESLYGNSGFTVLTFFTIPYYLTVNLVGDYILRPDKKINKSVIINPINIAIVLGFVLVIGEIPMGSFFTNFVTSAYRCVTPLSMLLAGMVLSSGSFAEMFKAPQVYIVSIIRLLVIPVILIFVFSIIGIQGFELSVPVLTMAMPVAVNGVMLAENSGGDSVTAARCAFVSTLISIITIPLLAYFIG